MIYLFAMWLVSPDASALTHSGQSYSWQHAVGVFTYHDHDNPYYAQAICSGTQIGPTSVLTSAGCVGQIENAIAEGRAIGDIVEWRRGTDAGSAYTEVPVAIAEAFIHPLYDSEMPHPSVDLAVVTVPDDLTNTVQCITDLPPQLDGMNVQLVGYGSDGTADGPSGIRRTGLARWTTAGSWRVTAGEEYSMACDADVGGPALVGTSDDVTGVAVLGVMTSFPASCTPDDHFGNTILAPVSDNMDFILSAVPAVEVCRNVVWEAFGAWEGPIEPPSEEPDSSGCDSAANTAGVGGGWLGILSLTFLRRKEQI